MSAYSDWKCGAISDDEYEMECAEETRRDEYLTKIGERPCDSCPHHIIVNVETGEGGCECWECEYDD